MEKEKTTRRLYYEDSHQREFDGEVLACETEGEAFQVLLRPDCFLPGRRRPVCRYRRAERGPGAGCKRPEGDDLA